MGARGALLAAIRGEKPASAKPVARGGSGAPLAKTYGGKDKPAIDRGAFLAAIRGEKAKPEDVRGALLAAIRGGKDKPAGAEPVARGGSGGPVKNKDNPQLIAYFKMKKYGTPDAAIKRKMETEGINPDLLDHPDDDSPADISFKATTRTETTDFEKRKQQWMKEHGVTEGDEFEIPQLGDMPVKSTMRPQRVKAKAKTFLDQREELRFSVFIKSLRYSPREFITKCNDMDVHELNQEDMITFRDIFPSSKLLNSATKVSDIEGYSTASHIVWYAAKASDLKNKVNAMVTYYEFSEDKKNIIAILVKAKYMLATIKQNFDNLNQVLRLFRIIIQNRVKNANSGREIAYWGNHDPFYLLMHSKKIAIGNPSYKNELEFVAHAIAMNVPEHANICTGVNKISHVTIENIEEMITGSRVHIAVAKRTVERSEKMNAFWSTFFSDADAFIQDIMKHTEATRSGLIHIMSTLTGKKLSGEEVYERISAYTTFCNDYIRAIRAGQMRKGTTQVTKKTRKVHTECVHDRSHDAALNAQAIEIAKKNTNCSKIQGSGNNEIESLIVMHKLTICIGQLPREGKIIYYPNTYWVGKRIDLGGTHCTYTFGDVLPIQSVVSDFMIRKKMKSLEENPKLVLHAGVILSDKGLPTLTDGHHSFIASVFMGRPILLVVKSKLRMKTVPRGFCDPGCQRCGYLRDFTCTRTLQGSDDTHENFNRLMGFKH